MLRSTSTVLGMLVAAAVPLDTPSAQNHALGQALAERHCSMCHAIGRTGESELPKAPPFRTLVERYSPEGLEEALAEGIVVGHPLMPEFVFEPEEIAGLIAYLRTLSTKDPQK